MTANKIFLSGDENVLRLVSAWLKTPEEKQLITGLDGMKVLTVIPAEKTAIPISTADMFNSILEMYETLGYPTGEIKKIIEPKIANVTRIFGGLEKLKLLKTRGVILDAEIYPTGATDRRGANRYNTWSKLSYKSDQDWYCGHACDISETGAQVLTWHNWNPEDIAEIKLRNFDNSEEIKVLGRVVW